MEIGYCWGHDTFPMKLGKWDLKDGVLNEHLSERWVFLTVGSATRRRVVALR